jgi:uncharacterized membrane protein YeaQ/YmgE (transglycosylase-associated protein family)
MLPWMLYAIVVSLLMGLAASRLSGRRRFGEGQSVGLGIIASLVIPFIPSRVSVQIPEMTRVVDRGVSSKILAPPQATATELSRFVWPIADTDQVLV